MRVACLVLVACGRIHFDVPPPVPPADLPQIALGGMHACERKADGTLWCWGRNNNGQLGLGTAKYGMNQQLPQQIAAAKSWSDVAPGGTYTCALDVSGLAWCWGADTLGQLGNAPLTCGNSVVDPGETCDDGNYLNGDGCNALCQTAPALPADVLDPIAVTGGRTYSRLAAGTATTCAIATDRTLWCWGDGGHGQLGQGNTRPSPFPVQVGTASNWVAVAVGDQHACAVQDDTTLWCWGVDVDGELGANPMPKLPGLVEPGSTWSAVDAGNDYECAIGDDERLYCLGNNDLGQLGLGDVLPRSVPTINADRVFDRVAAGFDHACGRTTAGALWCWGDNGDGEIGNGTSDPTKPSPPAQVSGTWTAVACGTDFTCALDAALAMWCWGSGSYGRLGDGQTADQPSPVLVELP